MISSPQKKRWKTQGIHFPPFGDFSRKHCLKNEASSSSTIVPKELRFVGTRQRAAKKWQSSSASLPPSVLVLTVDLHPKIRKRLFRSLSVCSPSRTKSKRICLAMNFQSAPSP